MPRTRDDDGGNVEGEVAKCAIDAQDGVVELAITDELDLHTFLPREVPSLIPDYLDECVRLGFREVRIIHGKGMGVLRRAVHAALDRHPCVVSYRPGGEGGGGWGATRVTLRTEKGDDP